MADHPAARVHWFRFLKLRHTVPYLTGYPLGSGDLIQRRHGESLIPAEPGCSGRRQDNGGAGRGVVDEEEVGKRLETEGVEWIGSPPAI